LPPLFPILFESRWPSRGLDEAVAAVVPDALCTEYADLREGAPRRSLGGKPYFVGHTGVSASTGSSNRLEEHFALALFNLGRRWPSLGGGWVRLLDYQVPLKARQSDANIGKIDLLGVTDQGRLVIVELKVIGHSGGRSDAPPAALMEGLRYAAMVEADLEAIAREAESRFGTKIARTPPIVQILAPRAWWREWLNLPSAGNWGLPFANLAAAVEARTRLTIECVAMHDVEVAYGLDGQAPRLDRVPELYSVKLAQTVPIGNALPPPISSKESDASHRHSVFVTLWNWADRHLSDQLDGGRRHGRPPVLKSEFAEKNVLVPPNGTHANEIRAAIEPSQRHRHFASLRSSQALAQSVFGTIGAFGCLDLLTEVTAEDGRPAFFKNSRDWTLSLEHEVDTLGEPRPTSIDVLLSGPNHRIVVECKFMESDFGTCSRPRLKPGEASYAKQHCDGSYRVQAGRTKRCALSEIGVRYWDYLPQLFNWPSDRDHEPCPFGDVYQLARNALAAVVTPNGTIDPAQGHALILYDARNPAFQAGGEADRQWEAALAACLIPGLMRRMSWQRLLIFIAGAPDLAWLVDDLREKYALSPN
jgi:hypothetical protein